MGWKRPGRKRSGLLRGAVALVCIGGSALGFLPAARAAGADLAGAFRQLPTYEWGASREALVVIEGAVVSSFSTRGGGDSAPRRDIERRLVAVLKSDATRAAKQFACRMLRRIGSAASVPALAELLADEDLSHMARFALQSMPTPKADEALREALRRVDDKLKVGLLSSLGARGDRRAVGRIAGLVNSRNLELARSAIAALGRIGGERAARVLARALVPAALEAPWADACLMCADGLLAEDRAREAVSLYEKLSAPDRPEHVRIAAFPGLIACRKDRAVEILADALTGEDAALRSAGIRCLRTVGGPDLVRLVAEKLPAFPAGARVQVIGALADRGDRVAAPGITRAAGSGDEAVRIAAIRALAALGDASSVELLAGAVSEGGRVGEAAATSLRRLGAPGADEAVIAAARRADHKLRVELIRCLASRGSTIAVPWLLRSAEDPDESVRTESLKALAVLADRESLPGLLRLLVKEPGNRHAENAVVAVAGRAADLEARAPPVLAALETATGPARCALLRVLGRIGGGAALGAVRGAMGDPDPDVRDAAARVLAGWPSPDAADDLLEMARTSAKMTHRVLALRGVVRLLGLPSGMTAKERAGMYARAMALARRDEDRRMVLSGLGSVAHIAALRTAERYLDDRNLGAEAGAAAVKIARAICGVHREEALSALRKVLRSSPLERVRKEAEEAIRYVEVAEAGVYEAESARVSGGSVDKNLAGFSGSGFVNYTQRSGGFIEWDISVAEAGKHTLLFQYALGGGNRPLKISVDGKVVAERVAFPSTGSWTQWKSVDVAAFLTEGEHRVRATTIGSEGPNMDCLKVVRKGRR